MKRLLLGLFILFTFTGCFLNSVHPLVSEKDAVLMPGLEGTWLNDDELWTFINDPRNVTNLDLSKYELDVEFEEGEEIEETIYLVLVQKLDENTVSDEEPYVLLGRIVQLNDHYFLDRTVDRADYPGDARNQWNPLVVLQGPFGTSDPIHNRTRSGQLRPIGPHRSIDPGRPGSRRRAACGRRGPASRLTPSRTPLSHAPPPRCADFVSGCLRFDEKI